MTALKPIHLGLALHSTHQMYWALLGQSVKERAAELGVRLSVVPYTLGDGEEAAQRLLQELRVDALIATTRPDEDVIVPRANAAGVPVLKAGGPGPDVICDVYGEEYQIAERLSEYLFQQIGYAGDVVEIYGWESVFERGEGFHAALARHAGIRVVASCNGHWSRAEACQHMRAALTEHPQVRGVFCHNDDLALGALDAIAEADCAGAIVVTGFDGVPDGLLAIQEGRLAATVYRSQRAVGRAAVDLAFDIARGKPVPAHVRTATTLVTADTLPDAMLDVVALVPKLLSDLVEGAAAQQRLQQDVITAQQSLIQELSTPVIPVADRVLLLPLIGAIDSARAQRITEALLAAIVRQRAETVMLDLTGVSIIDTNVASHLLQTIQSAQLLGAQVFVVGITPEVAQTVVALGINLTGVSTYQSVQTGLAAALRRTKR